MCGVAGFGWGMARPGVVLTLSLARARARDMWNVPSVESQRKTCNSNTSLLLRSTNPTLE